MPTDNQQSEAKQVPEPKPAPSIPLGKHTAANLRQRQLEIVAIQTVMSLSDLQPCLSIDRLSAAAAARTAALNASTTAIIADAGHDPAKWLRYELKGDVMHLVGGE
jgi:hypothetical protein